MNISNLCLRLLCRRRFRRRSWLKTFGLKPAHLILLLIVTFIVTFVTFLVTFYLNSDYLEDFIYYMFYSKPPSPYADSIRNYQPRQFYGKRDSLSFDQNIKYQDFDFLRPKTLTFEKRIYSMNIPILFRMPKKKSLSALLLIFHSCNQTAMDWFQTIERQRIIGAAIDLGYGCLIFQTTNHRTRCWSTNSDIYENNDVQMVFKGLEGFFEEFTQYESLPRFTFGESSGGLFSSIFAINQRFFIQGQIIFISIILPEILFNYVKAKNYPPTAWIHMLRDVEYATEERLNVSAQIFVEQNIPFKMFPVEPVELSPMVFHQRIPTMSQRTASYIFFRFQQNQWLNAYNFLLHNPRRKLTWKTFLFPGPDEQLQDAPLREELNEHRQVIGEFLNTVYGEHAISYERSFEAFRWFQQLYNFSQPDAK